MEKYFQRKVGDHFLWFITNVIYLKKTQEFASKNYGQGITNLYKRISYSLKSAGK